jgi:hypothetical protein
MPSSAPRIDSRLIEALIRIDDNGRPIAETNRRLGRVAEALDIPRPSYEQVRVLVHSVRNAKGQPGVAGVLLDIAFRVRPATAVLELLE